MKLKKYLVFALCFVVVICAIGIVACDKLQTIDMSGVSLQNKTELYDGTAKTLTITGTLPEGVTVAYEYYKGETKVTEAKDAGVYTVKAIFTVDTEKYHEISDMTATLTISYNMQGIVLENKTVTYNGEAHTLAINGTLPQGVTVAYEYYSGETKVTEAKNAGVYTVKAKFSGTTPIDDLTATLTINKAAPTVVFGSTHYKDGAAVKKLETPLVYQKDADNSYYFEYDGVEYVLGVVSSNVELDEDAIEYYTALNADNTPDEATITLDNSLLNAGDSLYVAVNVEESDNYVAKQFVAKITMQCKTVRISSFDDLKKVYSDTKEMTRNYRLNVKYVLENDIDCNNAVWKTPGSIWGASGNPFCSEFDGNGYTVSNFQLTNESVAETIDDQNGLHIGFFGYVTDAYIHDVTFDNVNANITTEGYTRNPASGGNCVNPIVFGVAVARMECDGSNGSESNLKNIKVSNADIKIAGYKAYVGIIIGWDHAKSEGILRDNLSVENVTINAIATTNDKDKVSVGGIVGETQGDDQIKYTDCSVKNLVMTSKDPDGNSTFSFGQNYFGALIGRVGGTSITFENCDVVNYAGIASVNIYISQDANGRFTGAGSYGYFGYGSYITDYGTLVNHPDLMNYRYFPSVLHLVNCTHSVEVGKEDEYYLEVNGVRVDWIDNDKLEAVGPNGELMFKDRSQSE